jgi:hypothetical protein
VTQRAPSVADEAQQGRKVEEDDRVSHPQTVGERRSVVAIGDPCFARECRAMI